ncbi:MAG: FG-GAP-like repeat-containing protein [Candidatus Zhuqueibacterota bacterium]
MKKLTIATLIILIGSGVSLSQAQKRLAILQPTEPGKVSRAIPIAQEEVDDKEQLLKKLAQAKMQFAATSDDAIFRDYKGDSLSFSVNDTGFVYFDPGVPCRIKEIGLFTQKVNNKMGDGYFLWIKNSNWHADTPPDSIDEKGWAGVWNEHKSWEPSDWGIYPTGAVLWGEFPVTALDGGWSWTTMEWLGYEPDVGLDDFCVVFSPYGDPAYKTGFLASDSSQSMEHHTWKYFHPANAIPGPDGEHYGWFHLSAGLAIYAVVEYYGMVNEPPTILQATQLRNTHSTGPFTVKAQITDTDEVDPDRAGVQAAFLAYSTDEGAHFDSTRMSESEQPNFYIGQIPSMPYDTQVHYYVSAFDSSGLYSRKTLNPFSIQLFRKLSIGEVTSEAKSSSGASWADYDNDGYYDLLVTNWFGDKNSLFRGGRNGAFTRITDSDLVNEAFQATSSRWADFDNDGDLDLFVTNAGGDNSLYENRNSGSSFSRIMSGSIVRDGGASNSCAWGDFDNDGFVDLFVANGNGENNFLYRNNHNGTFTKVTDGPVVNDGGSSTDGCWGDFDSDGDLDLFVTNTNNEHNFLYRNEGQGVFTKISDGIVVNDFGMSAGANWVDFDNDRDLDLFVVNSNQQFNCLYRNNGDGAFTKITDDIVVSDWGDSRGSAWADVDKDGDLDLFVANAGNQHNCFYLNVGNGAFQKQTSSEIATDYGQSTGVSWCDFDHDGDLDLFVTNDNGETNDFYQNLGTENNWINIKLVGSESNRAGIGAKVLVKATIDSSEARWQRREVSGQAKSSQSCMNETFGLGVATVIDSICVQWPSGKIQVLTDVAVNQFLEINEAEPIFTRVTSGNVVNDGGLSLGCSWGDYDGDGDDDLYVCNGSKFEDRPNFFYENNGDGMFTRIVSGAIVEDNKRTFGSSWADYDNDGDLDLFVTNYYGGYNALFTNDGNGNFSLVGGKKLATKGSNNTACSWVDYDNDGLLDLLATGVYSLFVLHNVGNGTLVPVSSSSIFNNDEESLGCGWSDFDNDRDVDLFIVNSMEHDAIFRNEGAGIFTRVTNGVIVSLPTFSNGCSWGDYDNDGNIDIFITFAYGHNKLYRNNGFGAFTPITKGPIVTKSPAISTGSCWGDFDNDGNLDLFVANNGSNNYFYLNRGDGNFTALESEAVVSDGGLSMAACCSDVDLDGDLDLFVSNGSNHDDQNNFLYLNNGNENNWINIRCIGQVSNVSAIGAKVKVMAEIQGKLRWQYREISSQTGYLSQNSLVAHFGLGAAEKIDSVVVEWPSGLDQVLTDISVNQHVTILETSSISSVITAEIPVVAAFAGDTILVPFNVRLPDYQHVRSAEIEVNGYFGSLSLLDVTTETSLTWDAGWTCQFNESDSVTSVWLAGGDAIAGAGALFYFKFFVPTDLVGFVPISLKSAVFDQGQIQVIRRSGGVNVLPPIVYGDVDLNGAIQAFDASLILQYLVGKVEFTGQQLLNANVTIDSTVSALDATMILKYGVGLIPALPADSAACDAPASGQIFMADQEVTQGQAVQVPLVLSNGQNIFSFEGKVNFNPEYLSLREIQWPEPMDNFALQMNEASGELKISGAGAQSTMESGLFANLNFLVKENLAVDSILVALEYLRWNENEPVQHAAAATLYFTSSIDEKNNDLPLTYALNQNYPNPFNQQTTIHFSLRDADRAQLIVYDERGCSVRTLVDENKSAGNYVAFWDGKNNLGESVASGMYICVLKIGKSVLLSRRMLLIK